MKPITAGGDGAKLYWLVAVSCIFGTAIARRVLEDYDDEDPLKDMKKCSTGYCVAIHLCKNGSIAFEGEGLIEERFGDEEYLDLLEISTDLEDNSDECEEFLLKCCKHGNEQLPSSPSIEPFKSAPMVCGKGHPQGYIYRVTNDNSVAQYGEFPWTAGLFREDPMSDDLQYFCGGSLVHRQAVLTAAHCLRNFSDPYGLTVRLGDWDIVNAREPNKHVDFTVRKIVKHEEWHPRKYHNDLALLILDRPATLGPNINTVCLPEVDESFDGKRCVAVGWGKDVKKGTYAEVLKKVKLPIVEHRACQRMLRQTQLGPIFQLHSSFMCAGGEAGVDTCKGDGGAPLMCDRGDGSYVQAGIVAWGMGCAKKNVPGVYVKVAKFSEWIEDQLNLEVDGDVRSKK